MAEPLPPDPPKLVTGGVPNRPWDPSNGGQRNGSAEHAEQRGVRRGGRHGASWHHRGAGAGTSTQRTRPWPAPRARSASAARPGAAGASACTHVGRRPPPAVTGLVWRCGRGPRLLSFRSFKVFGLSDQREPAAPGRVPKRRGTGGGHSRVSGPAQREPEAIHLDSDPSGHSGEGRKGKGRIGQAWRRLRAEILRSLGWSRPAAEYRHPSAGGPRSSGADQPPCGQGGDR